jgi:hypothetical protein
MHPLYHKCCGLVGRPLTVHLRDGRRHYGVIHRVTGDGIYFMPTGGAVVSGKSQEMQVSTADTKGDTTNDYTEVFFAPFFIPFAFLTGFALGSALWW